MLLYFPLFLHFFDPISSILSFPTILRRLVPRRRLPLSQLVTIPPTATMSTTDKATTISIAPLLARLADPSTTYYSITGTEVATAISHIFADSISSVQTGCLLYALHTTQMDRRPDILAACANSMRYASAQVDVEVLKRVVKKRGRREGAYNGGLVRINHSSSPTPATLPVHSTDPSPSSSAT